MVKYYLFLIITLALPFSALGKPNGNNWQDQESCLTHPIECIEYIDSKLPTIKKYSHLWYNLNNNLLFALWESGKEQRHKKELADIELDKGPPVFLTTVYTMKAKFAALDGYLVQARQYVTRAVELIKAVNEVSENMTRYSEIVVLYTSYLKDHDKAEAFAHWVEKEKAGTTNLVQMVSFNTAVGHLYSHKKEFKKAREYYQKALAGNLKTNFSARIALAYHNLARSYQLEEKYGEAIEYFTLSLTHYQKLGVRYETKGDYTRLRFIETLLKAERFQQARYVFSQIDSEILNVYFVPLYQQVKQLLDE